MSLQFHDAAIAYLEKMDLKKITPEAVLFDMDGVLYNSMPVHAYAWQKVFKERDLPFSEEEAYLLEGCTGAHTINVVFQRAFGHDATKEDIEEIYTEKSALFDKKNKIEIMDGAVNVLNKVKNSGLKRIMVTGSGQKGLLSRIERDFPHQFKQETMVTAFDVKKGKPDPEPYLTGLTKGGISANKGIVIENAPLGVRAAKAAGIFTVAVNTGKLKDKTLTEEGADVLFHGMQELANNWEDLYTSLKEAE